MRMLAELLERAEAVAPPKRYVVIASQASAAHAWRERWGLPPTRVYRSTSSLSDIFDALKGVNAEAMNLDLVLVGEWRHLIHDDLAYRVVMQQVYAAGLNWSAAVERWMGDNRPP